MGYSPAKRVLLYVAIGAIICAVIYGAVLAFGQPQHEQTESPTQTQNENTETSNWKTHTNSDSGFEFKYPSDWESSKPVYDGGKMISFVEVKNNSTGTSFEVVQLKNDTHLNIDDWFRESTMVNGRPTLLASATPVYINGVKGYRINSELEPPNPLFHIVGIANKNNEVFAIVAYSGAADDNNKLEGMLSTFTFTEKKAEALDWKTFNGNGFEFSYPTEKMQLLQTPNRNCFDGSESGSVNCDNYTVEVITDMKIGNEFFETSAGIQLMVIHHGLTLQDIHKYDTYPQIGGTVDVTQPMVIAGAPGYSYNLVSSTNYKIQGFIIPLDGNNYIEIYENSKYPSVTSEEWSKIIASFKLIK